MCGPSHRGSRLIGGDRVRMCGLADRFRCGMQARLTTNVPRVLIDCIRSYRLTSSASVPDRLIAEALLTHTSIPPNRSTANATAPCTWASSRMSPTTGSAWPPAASICAAAVYTVPSSFGCGSAVLAISATLAPSRAARSAIARPMPRLPPEINSVLPARLIAASLRGTTVRSEKSKQLFRTGRGITSSSAGLRPLAFLETAPGFFHLGLGGGAVGPGRVPDALARLQLLVDGEEVMDLQPVELGHVLELARVVLPRVAGRDTDDLVVTALLVGHPEHPDRAAADQAAGEGGLLDQDHRVERVAVLAQGVRDEAVVGRVLSRGEQRPVQADQAAFVVDLVLVPAAPRDLDQDVEFHGYQS